MDLLLAVCAKNPCSWLNHETASADFFQSEASVFFLRCSSAYLSSSLYQKLSPLLAACISDLILLTSKQSSRQWMWSITPIREKKSSLSSTAIILVLLGTRLTLHQTCTKLCAIIGDYQPLSCDIFQDVCSSFYFQRALFGQWWSRKAFQL